MKTLSVSDFKVNIKRWDKINNLVLVNLLICHTVEIRGYQVRFTSTKMSSNPLWIVSPPSIKSNKNKKYFWMVKIDDGELWQQIKLEIIGSVIEYTNLR